VCAAGAVAAGLLAVPVSRVWRDRTAAAFAVLFAFLPPLPYVVVGNGNLTNAFGQSMALVALLLIAMGAAGARAWWAGLALAAVLTLAFTSHVGTVTLLLAALGATAAGLCLAERRAFRRDVLVIVMTTVLAFALAFGLYYRHFLDVYREAATRVLSPASATVLPPRAVPDTAPGDERSVMLVRQLTWSERASDALSQSAGAVGWPLLLLAVAGAIRTWRVGWRDRLSVVAIALAVVWGALVLTGTFLHVGTQYQRYASEFMGRVCLATYPAIVLFAARGAAWPWAPGATRWTRVLSIALSAAAIAIGARAWLGWFW
jgi:hypothetical protein